ncbi:MAG: hypothetical protein IPG00_14250 [Saprospiraceae bacterium]|nr:hypothetical protein [Saprospiraceae bacterium]
MVWYRPLCGLIRYFSITFDTQNKNLPKLTLVKQNSLYVNGTGTSACVVRELSYQPTFDNNLRQTIYMEKDGENWLVKMISLGHLLPNGQ